MQADCSSVALCLLSQNNLDSCQFLFWRDRLSLAELLTQVLLEGHMSLYMVTGISQCMQAYEPAALQAGLICPPCTPPWSWCQDGQQRHPNFRNQPCQLLPAKAAPHQPVQALQQMVQTMKNVTTVNSRCKDTQHKDIFSVRTMQLRTKHCVLTIVVVLSKGDAT